MALADIIIGVESGGNRYAKNPRSSAYGPGQFIESTWLNMIGKYRPDLASSMSRSQLLGLRSDPEISRAMTDAYAKENADYLRSKGFAPTEQNIYLSHFAGPKGAVALLSNPDAPASSILSAKAIESNPYLAKWSAQEVIDWAGDTVTKGGGKTADGAGGMLGSLLSGQSVAAPAARKTVIGDLVGSMGAPKTGGMLSGILGALTGGGRSSNAAQQQSVNALNSTMKADNQTAQEIINKSRQGLSNVTQSNQQMARNAMSSASKFPSDLLQLSEVLQSRAMRGV